MNRRSRVKRSRFRSTPAIRRAGGTVNLEGQAVIRVRRLPSESAVQRIIDLIERAREQKAPAQRFTDVFSRYYTVVILVGSVAFLAFLLLWLREPFSQAIYRMMTLLVVASPCALVLSIPSAILVAIASGARQGILFRGGVAVEDLAGVHQFAFDKTGTLTTGRLQVARVEARGQVSAEEVLEVAAAVGQYSTHPLSRAVVEEAKRLDFKPREAGGVTNIPGFGVEAMIGAQLVVVGSRRLMEMRGFDVSALESKGAEAEVGAGAKRCSA